MFNLKNVIMKTIAYNEKGQQFVNLVSDAFIREVLDSIDDTIADNELTTDSERIRFFTEVFIDEFGWQVHRIGWLRAIEDYLRGIPSTIHLPIWNNEILSMGHRLGDICEEELHRVSSRKMEDLEFYYIDEFYGRVAWVLLTQIGKEFVENPEWEEKIQNLLLSKK